MEEIIMEWTRAKRYLPYNKWDAATLLHLQAQAANSPYQMHYHLRPISGLINDPNGFSYFKHEYHLFYQSYPFGAAHGLKSWVHFKSNDLVHWQLLGLANEPNTEADSHGAYSGSAKEINGKLFIMYTGNHRDENWVRTPYQVGAWLDKNGQISHKTVLFKNPSTITEHFRDPQIICRNGRYYALVGAQDQAQKHGHIDVWWSEDLKKWHEIGFLKMSNSALGYMIECPNLVWVDGQPVLIFCPQGLDKKVAPYQNIYPNMYVMGDDIDLDKAEVKNPKPLRNLDEGFDVYATQAFNMPDGTAYEISWVGLPDTTYPTDKENWANCLSQVKKLSIKNGHLLQQPVKAIKSLRANKLEATRQEVAKHAGNQYELKLTIAKDQKGTLCLAANNDLNQGLALHFDTQKGQLVLDRSHTEEVSLRYGTTRTVSLKPNKKLKLDIFVDHSLIEVFVNKGQHVLTARFFTNPSNQRIAFEQNTAYHGKLWQINSTN